MADIYLDVPTGGKQPKSTKFMFQYKGNTYHFDDESTYKKLLQELQEIDQLQDKNKKFMIK